MTQEEIDSKAVLLKDSTIQLSELVAKRHSMGVPLGDIMDTLYVSISVVFALECSSLVYKTVHFKRIFEMADRLLLRCQRYE